MASEFDFLRIKWPKMAALAADASRLVDVSPSSAISSMRTFCEWAVDIALDMYKVQVMSGATQMEKLEALQATGRVPAEILQKFHNIRTAGNDAVHRALGDAETARESLEQTKEIGQWLFKESDSHARPKDPSPIRRVPLEGLYPEEESPRGGSMLEGNRIRPAQFFRQFAPQMVLVAGIVLVIGIIIFIVLLASRCSKGTKNIPADTVGPSPTAAVNYTPQPTPEPTLAPSPTPEVFIWLDSIEPSSDFKGLYLEKWTSTSYTGSFQMNNKLYEHGIGMFVASRFITHEQGSESATWPLLGKYKTLVFDLGCDQNWGYGQNNGYFRIIITVDDKDVIIMEGMKDYLYFAENVTVDVTGCQSLEITLTEKKGSAGTLNVVLGNARLYESVPTTVASPTPGTGTAGPTGTPGASPTAGTSPSPSPTPAP